MKSIFQRDKKLDNKSKKKRKRMKVKQDKAKVVQMKKRMDRELEKMEQKRWNELKQELPEVKLEKRFSPDDNEDIDLMEVDDIDSPICDETAQDSMTVTNNDDDHGFEEASNHDNKACDSHDNQPFNGEI